MNKIKVNLFIKFSAIISLSLVVILTVLGMMIINIQEKSMITEKDRNAAILTRIIANISAFHIEKYSYYMLDEITLNLQSKYNGDFEVLSVQIFDNDGKRLNLKANDPDNIFIHDKYLLIKEEKCMAQKNTVGNVKIYFSLLSVYRIINNAKKMYIMILFISVVILNIILILVLYILVSKPLRGLTEAAESITEGGFDIDVKINSNDELGFLGETFTNMSKRLKNNFEEIERQKVEIENYNKHLEDLVKQRTEELALVNDNLLLANVKMKKEFQMAQKIQNAIIPKDLPNSENLNVGGIYIPMDELGGDYYDVFYITENKVAVVVADVCGHGVPAALITTMAKVSFKSNARIDLRTEDIVRKVNEELYSIIGQKEYLTAFFCIVDLEELQMEWTNAGHNPIYILKSNGGVVELMSNSGFVGFSETTDFSTETTKIDIGDRIIFYTDGIPESKNENSELYGYERFKSFILNNSNILPKELVVKIIENVAEYRGTDILEDDMTVLIMDIKSNSCKVNVDLGIATEKIL